VGIQTESKLMIALLWLKDNWRLAALVLIVAALGVQTYRLQGVRAARDALVLEKVERVKRDAMREAQNLKNRERTDEEYAAAIRRAKSAGVLPQSTARISTEQPELAPGGDSSTLCFDRGTLNDELAGYAQRAAARLTDIIADVSQRDAERLSAINIEGEEVSAAYRACRAYVLNLAGSAPGKAEHDRAVGGVAVVPALPVLRLSEEWEGETNNPTESAPSTTTSVTFRHAHSAP
jgi:hypothetical protein